MRARCGGWARVAGHVCEGRALTRRAPGKVHGGLARAGKVRGQTPKVDVTEKPKRPKGRAMKRIQFNKRVRVLLDVCVRVCD